MQKVLIVSSLLSAAFCCSGAAWAQDIPLVSGLYMTERGTTIGDASQPLALAMTFAVNVNETGMHTVDFGNALRVPLAQKDDSWTLTLPTETACDGGVVTFTPNSDGVSLGIQYRQVCRTLVGPMVYRWVSVSHRVEAPRTYQRTDPILVPRKWPYENLRLVDRVGATAGACPSIQFLDEDGSAQQFIKEASESTGEGGTVVWCRYSTESVRRLGVNYQTIVFLPKSELVTKDITTLKGHVVRVADTKVHESLEVTWIKLPPAGQP